MLHRRVLLVLGVVLLAAPLAAQDAPAPSPPAVGLVAPDFTLISATRAGVGELVSLRDFKGQVVVVAFFYRARSSG